MYHKRQRATNCRLVRYGVMPSSVIRRFAYDEMEANLWVEFTTGRRYVYSNVPQEVADALRGAFAKGVQDQRLGDAGRLAKGAYFNTRIRDRYQHREVTHEDHATES